MEAILGRIVSIQTTDIHSSESDTTSPLSVTLQPTCLLPERASIPEWLKDTKLTVSRAPLDPREVGREGDSIVLAPGESDRFLHPLRIDPVLTVGHLAETLTLHLRWWKDETPPNAEARANGRVQTLIWKRDGDKFTASLETHLLFSSTPPTLPIRIDIRCGALKASYSALPSEENHFRPVATPYSERHRAANPFLVAEITASCHAGGIVALLERGRGLDHFGDATSDLIAPALERAGHHDRVRVGWEVVGKMKEASLACTGSRRDAGAARLMLEGKIEDDLRTAVSYTLYDDLPLLLMQRDYYFEKKEEKGDDKADKPKELVDDLKPVAFGFRSSSRVDPGSSRILCGDGESLVTVRPSDGGEYKRYNYWSMADGWAIVEHPIRRSYLLYLMDPTTPPNLAFWMGRGTIVIEPDWPYRPARPGNSAGVSLALAAGELAGASADGVWLATRAPFPNSGGVLCAVVARLKDGTEAAQNPTVAFRLGSRTRAATLERAQLPGVGRVYTATVAFEDGALSDDWDVAAAGIGSRRAPRN